jgi:hypothetical protein
LYGGDISSFAGQVADLTVTSLGSGDGGVNPFALDDIQLSSSPVPEPSTLSLVGICLLFVCYRRFRPNGMALSEAGAESDRNLLGCDRVRSVDAVMG